MEKEKIWQFVKYLAFVIMSILSIVLIAQYIQLNKINNQNKDLNNQLNVVSRELSEKEKMKSDISENYNEFVEDKCKEEYNMKKDNEEVIIGK